MRLTRASRQLLVYTPEKLIRARGAIKRHAPCNEMVSLCANLIAQRWNKMCEQNVLLSAGIIVLFSCFPPALLCVLC